MSKEEKGGKRRMQFRKAYHIRDANGKTQTIGVDKSGSVHLGAGFVDGDGEYYARFDADEALRLAFELANLARYAKTVQRQSET